MTNGSVMRKKVTRLDIGINLAWNVITEQGKEKKECESFMHGYGLS